MILLLCANNCLEFLGICVFVAATNTAATSFVAATQTHRCYRSATRFAGQYVSRNPQLIGNPRVATVLLPHLLQLMWGKIVVATWFHKLTSILKKRL